MKEFTVSCGENRFLFDTQCGEEQTKLCCTFSEIKKKKKKKSCQKKKRKWINVDQRKERKSIFLDEIK